MSNKVIDCHSKVNNYRPNERDVDQWSWNPNEPCKKNDTFLCQFFIFYMLAIIKYNKLIPNPTTAAYPKMAKVDVSKVNPG